MKTRRVLGIAALLTTIALLAGCSGSSASVAEGSAGAGALPAEGTAEDRSTYTSEEDASVPEAAPAGAPGSTVTQKLARTARVSLTVTDVEAAAAQLRDIATTMGGQVTAENLVTAPADESEGRPVSTLVVTVPADRLDSTLDQLKSVGKIISRVIASEDVTTQVADIDSRIATLNASIDRLRELSGKAGSIRELTELEGQLTERISERDSLIAQQKSLEGRVAQSPITITLALPGTPEEPEVNGFLGGLIAGWNALVASSRVLLTILGAIVPFAAAIALVGVPLLLWRRHVRRPKTVGGADEGDAGES